MKLQNCCSEVAVQAAQRRYFPNLHTTINAGEIANNDSQIDLGQVFQNIPGDDLDFFELSDQQSFERMLGKLNMNSVYCDG